MPLMMYAWHDLGQTPRPRADTRAHQQHLLSIRIDEEAEHLHRRRGRVLGERKTQAQAQQGRHVLPLYMPLLSQHQQHH